MVYTCARSITDDTHCPLVKKMASRLEKEDRSRAAPRNPTEAAVECRLYTSRADIRASQGVMHNFSTDGSYIETSHKFNSGTILIVRIVRYPRLPFSLAEEELPRSICLAEVKWLQEMAEGKTIRFGLGLKYLD